MTEWSWEGTDYSEYKVLSETRITYSFNFIANLKNFYNAAISDTISLMINIGNETYPNSVADFVNQSDVEPPDLEQSEDDQGWDSNGISELPLS